MTVYLTLIFCCQLLGELIVAGLGLPVPGPVCGMLLLLAGLLIHGSIPKALEQTAEALLANMSLLFIPAGVGVMLHAGLMGRDWLPISLALLISTLLTIAVTALAMATLSRGQPEGDTPAATDPN